MKYLFYFFGIVLILVSCKSETHELVTNPKDYNQYLSTNLQPTFSGAKNEVEFWSKRLQPDSSGVGDLGPLAGAYTKLFETTGNITKLKNAEALYVKAMDISANNKDIYARRLAHNYISQHRFTEATNLLEASYKGISSKRATEFILFDVMMELGRYDEAEDFLKKLKNTSDYSYLIRQAKWSDYKGNLSSAIKYMEKAKAIADSRGSKSLKIWTYTNLADFYGHAGRIQEAYTHCLKTLQIQPDNAYAKKGIAWIAYSYENNAEEAGRILDSIMKNHKSPDYYLFLADMAENENNESEANVFKKQFIDAVTIANYGNMYNTYLIALLAETNPEDALALAQQEVLNRSTPETQCLLAYTNLKAGKEKRALEIIKKQVEGKTFEPMSFYYSSLIYKANGLNIEVRSLKKELSKSYFELGPVLAQKIEEL